MELTAATRELLLAERDNLREELELQRSIVEKSDDEDLKQFRQIKIDLLKGNIDRIFGAIVKNTFDEIN